MDFGKLQESAGRNSAGTGLGLSFSKLIIDQMGGEISVDSQLGVGTVFSLDLKFKCRSSRCNYDETFGGPFEFLIKRPGSEIVNNSFSRPRSSSIAMKINNKRVAHASNSSNGLNNFEPLKERVQIVDIVDPLQADNNVSSSDKIVRQIKIVQDAASQNSEARHLNSKLDNSTTRHLNFKCLVVNDEKNQLLMIENLFKQHGFEVSVAENGKQAIEMVLFSIKKEIAQIS